MLLAVDIGNTHIVLGLFESDKLIKDWRIFTDRNKTADQWNVEIGGLLNCGNLSWDNIKNVVISSVVPDLTMEIRKLCLKDLGIKPLIVDYSLNTGIKIKLRNPEEAGADRIVNAVAAFEKYGQGRPVIVADYGTATTFDVINSKGEYIGGAILPGVGISVDALFIHAAKLSKIEYKRPSSVIGRSTIESMQSGVIFGFASQFDGMVEKMKEELGEETFVIATGGLASIIAEECTTINKIDKFLTLEGLKIINNKCSGNTVK
jgi:type III pantothenate kinase